MTAAAAVVLAFCTFFMLVVTAAMMLALFTLFVVMMAAAVVFALSAFLTVMVMAAVMLTFFTFLMMVMTAAVVLALFILFMMMVAAAAVMLTLSLFAGAMAVVMHMAMSLFLFGGRTHVFHGDEEGQGLAGQRMVAVHHHGAILDFLDHHAHSAAVGVGLKHSTFLKREIAEHHAVNFLYQRRIKLAVSIGRM